MLAAIRDLLTLSRREPAHQLAPKMIRVNSLSPGRIGGGIVFLASPASSFTTGTNLVIDGALTRRVQL
jgi:NAD(P)-dependent dehydrogenase (short-subunit alcohol dehydrogenase family)